MKTKHFFPRNLLVTIAMLSSMLWLGGCQEPVQGQEPNLTETATDQTPEYFLLRPEVEKAYGYSHAVKIGNEIKISGAVSMDDQGNPTAVGDMAQQLKNCYADLQKILTHFGCSFDDVVVENIFTTSMSQLMEHAAYRNTIYTNHYPTAIWVGVSELALPEFMVEIELEVYTIE